MTRATSRSVAFYLGPILVVLASASAARPSDLTWCNVAGPGVGSFVDGSVTDWNAAGLWWDGAANVNWPATGATALFGSSGTGSAIVTISSPTVVQGMTFLPAHHPQSGPQYTISNLGDASQFQLSGTINLPGTTGALTTYAVLDGGVTFNGPISAVNASGGLVLQGSVSNVGTDTFTFAGKTLLLNKSGSAVAIPGPLVISSGGAVLSSPTQLSPSSLDHARGRRSRRNGHLGRLPQPITANGSYVGIGLDSGVGNVTFTGDINLLSDIYLTGYNATATAVYAGNISGPGGVILYNTVKTVFAGSNSYTGQTTVNGGNLTLASSSAWSAASALVINNNGICDLNGYDASFPSLSVAGGTLTNSSPTPVTLTVTGSSILCPNGAPGFIGSTAGGGLTLDFSGGGCNFANLSGELSIAAVIANDGGHGLVLSTTQGGGLILSASNTYTGPTVIQSGYIGVSADVTPGVPGPLGSASSAVQVGNAMPGQRASLWITSSGVNFSRPILTQSASGGVATVGMNLGSFYTSGSSAFTGDIVISGSTNLAVASVGTVAFNGAISGSGNVSISGYGTVSIGGVETYEGTSTIVLNGANTYQGSTTLDSCTLVLGSDFVPGVSGPIGPGPLSLGTAKIAPGGGDRVLPNAISLDGNTIFGNVGDPALVFMGSLTVTGTRYLTINNTTTFAGPVSGAGSLIRSGSGTLILGGGSADSVANTFSGATIVYPGTLVLDKMAGTPAISGSLTVSGGTVVSLRPGLVGSDVALTVTYGEIDFNGSSLSLRSLNYSGGTIAGIVGTITLSGSTTPLTVSFPAPPLNYGVALTGASPGGSPPDVVCSSGINGPIDLGDVTRWFFSNNGNGAQLNGAITGNGGLGVTSTYSSAYSTIVLANSGNSYAGPTQIGAAGRLVLGASQAIPATSNLIDYGQLRLAGYSETLPSISGSGTVTMGGGTLTVGSGGGATTFSGMVAVDAGELVKTGSGSLALTQSTSRYQGTVEVQGGTLTMAGGFQGPGERVDVQPGARLRLTTSNNGTDFSTVPLTNAGIVDFLGGAYGYSSGGTLGGTVNLSGSGVTLGTNRTLTLPGVTNWTGGALSSVSLLGGGTFSIPSGGSASITAVGQTLGYATFDVAGQATLAGSGSISGSGSGAQLRIESGGTLDITGNAGFTTASGTPAINNAGLFSKLAGTGTSAVAWAFNNTGAVDVESGTLAFSSGGTESGAFTIGPSGAIAFTGGTFNINGPMTVAGSAITFAGGTFNINGPMTVAGSAILSGANLGGSGSASFTNLLWSSGTLSNTGGIDIAANQSLVLSGTPAKTLSGALLSLDGSGLWSGSGTLTAAGAAPSALNIDSGGLFDLPGSASFTNNGAGVASLNNAGLLRKLSGTGSVALGSGWTWTNTGVIDVEKGSFVFGSGTGSGTFTVGNGASLIFSSGTSNLSGASFAGSGTVNLIAPAERFDSATSISCLTVLGSGAITGGGVVSFNNLNWTGGTLAGGGVAIPSGGSLSIAGSGNRVFSSSHLAVAGSAALTTTGSIVAAGGASTLDVLAGGLFDLQSAATFSTSGAGSATINNAGTFRKSLSTSASLNSGWSFSNSGTIDVRGGTLGLNSLASDGTANIAAGADLSLTGTGNLAGTVFSNSGTVDFLPGSFPVATSYALDGVSLGGPGTFLFSGGSATVGIPTTLAGTIQVSPLATMKIDADTVFSGPVDFLGMLSGSGTTTFRNLTFQGAMSGSGTTAVASGGNMSMPTSSLSHITRPLSNSGLLALTSNGLSATVSSLIVNQSSGTVSLAVNTLAELGGTGTISTAGLFQVQAAGVGSGNCQISANFDNSGVVEAKSVSLSFMGSVAQFSGGTLTGGTWIADSNSSIRFPGLVSTNRANLTMNGISSSFFLSQNFENDGSLTLQNQAVFSQPSGSILDTGTINLGVNTIMTAGAVSVQDGGLLIDNGYCYAAVTVATGGTLAGSGTAGAVILDGHLAPGNSPGTLTSSQLQLDPGCNLDFDLGGTKGNDLLVVTGGNGLALNGGMVNVSDWNNGLTPGIYPVIQYAGTPLTSLGGLSVGQLPDGFGGTLLLNATGPTSVDLQLYAVPEPSTFVLLSSGVIALLLRAKSLVKTYGSRQRKTLTANWNDPFV